MFLNGLSRALAIGAALLLARPALAIDPLPPGAAIAADPAVKTGTLSNGLRYAVRRNATPAGSLSIRLAVRVGSYEETEAELGFAHFVEHMAFRSTKQAPEGSLDTRFASMGVAFGRDLNAVTMLEATVYQMNLPSGGLANGKVALEWLRGAADGILFTDKAVDLERGVVLAEIRAHNNPGTILMRRTIEFQAPGLRSLRRDPGGTEESIKAATTAGLQAFYDRWYRPDNATLILVGDAPVEELLKLAEASFGDWKARGAPGTRPSPPEKLAERSPDAMTSAEPSLAVMSSACRGMPLDGPRQGLEALRREALSVLWTTILKSRLAVASDKPGSPLLGAEMLVNRGLPDARFSCLVALPTDGKWKEALAVAQAEMRRFAAEGPTPLEVAVALAGLRSRLETAVATGAVRQSSALAEEISEAELGRRPVADPAESLRVFDMLVSGVTPADLKQAFERDWSGTGPLLALNAGAPVAKEAVLAAWAENEAAKPLEAYADAETATWQYARFGKRGKVARREVFADAGFTRLVFKNGVVLNFKQTDFESDAVEVRIRFGHGERGLSPAERLPGTMAASFLPLGGLGRMDQQQISSIMGEGNWSFQVETQASGFVISNRMVRAALQQQLPLFAAFLTDPGFRSTIDDKLPTAMDLLYRAYKAEPNAVVQETLDRALFPDRPSLPPREEMTKFKSADFKRMLRPALTGSPLEITIVGDITEKDAKEAVALTLGALPPRGPLGKPPGEGPFKHFPAQLPAPVTGYHEGPADKAAALLMWPLYTASYERRREEYAIALLRSIFEMRLLHEVRVVMGKVYSPSVSNVMIDGADQGFLSAALEATPADIDALVAATRKLAGELASGAITQQEVDAARQPLLATNDQALRHNGMWAGVLSHTYRNPNAIHELTRYRADMEALTLEDVRKAAATWLSGTPAMAKALPKPR